MTPDELREIGEWFRSHAHFGDVGVLLTDAADAWQLATEDRDYWKSIAMDWERKSVGYMKRLEVAEKENVYLRANMPMSVLRRLKEQAAIAGKEKP